jgi:formate hydrogenlyase transcriptional activator
MELIPLIRQEIEAMPDDSATLKKQISDQDGRILKLQQLLEDRRFIQDQNDELLRFERLLAEISSKLIKCSPLEAQKQITYGLELLAEFLDADQIGIGEFCSGERLPELSHFYSKDNTLKISPNMLNDIFYWGMNQVKERKLIVWHNIPEDVPVETEGVRRCAIKNNLKGYLGVPLIMEETVIGGLGCFSFTKQRNWNNDLIQRFRLLGEILANTIVRYRSELKLQDAFRKIRKLNEQLQVENLYLREEVNLKHRHENIVGSSRAIKKVLKLVEQVASTKATVLISGDTGTGKELIAHAIHKLSPRNGKALVTLNCAALPSPLVESELFGHEKGAYTGASAQKQGRFEVAHGSTIFLDEINSLSMEIQAKLLRFLQQGTFERLGSTKTIKVDVRIIAASNKDLKREVAAGVFREDLFYRLNVFPIKIPSLMERQEDIPLLVMEFVTQFSKQMGRQIDNIPTRSMEILKNHFWPGNVRELKNVIERAMILTRGTTLMIPHLDQPAVFVSQDQTLDGVQRRHILDVLEKTGWRVSGENGAAQILGINSKTLDSRMRKLKIHRPSAF